MPLSRPNWLRRGGHGVLRRRWNQFYWTTLQARWELKSLQLHDGVFIYLVFLCLPVLEFIKSQRSRGHKKSELTSVHPEVGGLSANRVFHAEKTFIFVREEFSLDHKWEKVILLLEISLSRKQNKTQRS
jgi:hypothetical protein